MEFTPNFNDNAGGFIVDPNAAAVRRQVRRRHRPRRLAQQRVLRPAERRRLAPLRARDRHARRRPRRRSRPYVDGKAVTYEKLNSGTGAGNFANSTLYLMSRGGSALFGGGGLDEVAIYNRALTPATIADHFGSQRHQQRADGRASRRRRTRSRPGQPVTFDASGSSDPDGTIAKYEWDLDGDGSYETDTGSTPTATKTYADRGRPSTVKLRVTDDQSAPTRTTTTAHGRQPAADRLLHGLAATRRQSRPGRRFDASGSADPDGSIAEYEWDLDGNGTLRDDHRDPDDDRTFTTAGTIAVGAAGDRQRGQDRPRLASP